MRLPRLRTVEPDQWGSDAEFEAFLARLRSVPVTERDELDEGDAGRMWLAALCFVGAIVLAGNLIAAFVRAYF